MLARREAIIAPILGVLGTHSANACTFAPRPRRKNEKAKAFLDALVRGKHHEALDLLSDEFWFCDASNSDPKQYDKSDFSAYLKNLPDMDEARSWAKVIEDSDQKLVQIERWKFQDKPERRMGTCGYFFNYRHIVAIYSFAVDPPPAIEVTMPDGSRRITGETDFRPIRSIVHVGL